ncbi:hypothetical protein TSUD_416490 [Trifolium subterraneum]|uniref:Endonuclease/exonuclease/phosphatase domain-containing protein n=1 Tax=Trifolium subterraneum TaxID=3900 RepID=A0A2Z6PLH8_TRISU|nr:hypothetical protein TSUD_416490 [Trifolium subterraneum]
MQRTEKAGKANIEEAHPVKRMKLAYEPGLCNPRTVRALHQLIANNHPDIIFLMETKKHKASNTIMDKFAATYNLYSVDYIIDMDFNYIDFIVTNTNNANQWRGTGIYGYPQHHNKHLTYNPIDNTITTLFRSTLNSCDLQDLGYKGDIYTWINKQQGNQLIKERLDRFLGNSEWMRMFPNFSNTHLLRYKSDHAPILLDFNTHAAQNNPKRRPKPKRYEQIWTRDESHYHIVKNQWRKNRGSVTHKINNTLLALHRWGNERFGIIPKRIKTLQEDLQKLNEQMGSQDMVEQVKNKEKELDDILECEEMWWKQRSRALWLQHGDKNTNSEATTWSEAKQSSEAQRGSKCLQEFRSSEKFRSSRMFRCLQEFRSYLLVMSHSEDEDVQKLNYEGLSEANHSRPIRLQVI